MTIDRKWYNKLPGPFVRYLSMTHRVPHQAPWMHYIWDSSDLDDFACASVKLFSVVACSSLRYCVCDTLKVFPCLARFDLEWATQHDLSSTETERFSLNALHTCVEVTRQHNIKESMCTRFPFNRVCLPLWWHWMASLNAWSPEYNTK